MGISIKNEDVEAMIRQLAQLSGESVTDTVRHAIEDRLALFEEARKIDKSERLKRVREILAEARRLPVYDDRPMEEMLYDSGGLPK